MKNEFRNKIVLVTGGTGSIGSVLVEKILDFRPKQLRVLSRDENKQYYLMEKLGNPRNVRFFIGDIRDKERLIRAFQNVDIVFHAAALKHVPLCEYNPFEAVKTNIIGSQNIIDASIQCNVRKIIAISTDKAVHPNNVMGTSKLMMEKLFTSANYYSGKSQAIFSCVRFGNVAWANGSVLKLWENQIQKNGRIEITDPDMTRFFMTTSQAINLVLQTVSISQGGEIFVLKMPSITIGNLAKAFLTKYYKGKNIPVKIIGKRAGEKMHEELLDRHFEPAQMLENNNMMIVLPITQVYNRKYHPRSYKGFKKVSSIPESNSSNCINKKMVEKLI